MNDYICLLITIYYRENGTLLRVALKVKREVLGEDCIKYPLEPENREKINELLPMHVRSCGSVVSIDEIFEIVHPEIKEGECDAKDNMS